MSDVVVAFVVSPVVLCLLIAVLPVGRPAMIGLLTMMIGLVWWIFSSAGPSGMFSELVIAAALLGVGMGALIQGFRGHGQLSGRVCAGTGIGVLVAAVIVGMA